MPQRSSNQKKFDISAVWSCGPRTSQWDRLWARLLSYALEPSLQPPETKKTNCVQEEPPRKVTDVLS